MRRGIVYDIAMEGGRGIAESFGGKPELGEILRMDTNLAK